MSDDKLSRIENKVDKIDEKLNSIDSTLAAQHQSLKEHMRRTEVNEMAVAQLAQELKPVINHVAIVQFLGKVFALVLSSELVYLMIERLRK